MSDPDIEEPERDIKITMINVFLNIEEKNGVPSNRLLYRKE